MTHILYDKVYEFLIWHWFKLTEGVNREIPNIGSLTEDRFNILFMAIFHHCVGRNIEIHRTSINLVIKIESESETVSFHKICSAIENSIAGIQRCMRKTPEVVGQSYFTAIDDPQFKPPAVFITQKAFRFQISFDQPLQIVGLSQTRLIGYFRVFCSYRILFQFTLVRRLSIFKRSFSLLLLIVHSWVEYVNKVRQFFSSSPRVGDVLFFSRQQVVNIFRFHRWKNPFAIGLMFIL